MRNFQLFIKRAFDIVASLIMIIMLIVIPVFIIVPIIIKLTSKGPAVFVQERMGKDGKVFNIYKFRTMSLPPEGTYSVDGVLYKPNGELLEPSSKRITKVGAFLRKTSIDELMQLFNILNGTMTFVGPRPTLPYQAESYTDEQRRRFEMRPGVTGWAQIHGRKDVEWNRRIEMSVWYVDHVSFWLDLTIFFLTIYKVFRNADNENKEETVKR